SSFDSYSVHPLALHSFPTRRSSDLVPIGLSYSTRREDQDQIAAPYPRQPFYLIRLGELVKSTLPCGTITLPGPRGPTESDPVECDSFASWWGARPFRPSAQPLGANK